MKRNRIVNQQQSQSAIANNRKLPENNYVMQSQDVVMPLLNFKNTPLLNKRPVSSCVYSYQLNSSNSTYRHKTVIAAIFIFAREWK